MANIPTDDVIVEMESRFRSGNSVPIERAMMKADEWAVIREELRRNEHALDIATRVLADFASADASGTLSRITSIMETGNG